MADLNKLVQDIVDGVLADLKARTGRNARESLWDLLGEPGEEDIRTDLGLMVTGKLVTSGLGPKLSIPFDTPERREARGESLTDSAPSTMQRKCFALVPHEHAGHTLQRASSRHLLVCATCWPSKEDMMEKPQKTKRATAKKATKARAKKSTSTPARKVAKRKTRT